MQPILELQPLFIKKQALVWSTITAFIFFMFLGILPLLYMWIVDITFSSKAREHEALRNTYIISFALTIIPTIIFYYIGKLTYAKTYYNFFADKIIYRESFLIIEEKEFSYNRIVETSLKRGIIQQFFETGSVSLMTFGTGNSHSSSGLKLKDLENPENTYTQITAILAQAKAQGEINN